MEHEQGIAQPPTSEASDDLTIGDLADRTGVSPAVLRMWETRHGFPEPRRLSSGHRRYSAADVELVRHVLRRKEAGTKLEVAIAEASATQAPPAPSIFAEMRRKHPTLIPQRLKKSTLIALSWAIEDECCATASAPTLFGAFQKGDHFEPAATRWTELARVARAAIVFADQWDGTADDAVGPVRAALADDAPMRREWAVVCDAPDLAACLSAWELPGQTGVRDRDRVFEAVWTLDPVAVRDAARVAASVAASAGVLAAAPLVTELAGAPSPRAVPPPGATAMFNRVIGYVDRLT